MASKESSLAPAVAEGAGHEKAAISETPSELYNIEDGEGLEMDDKEMKRILRKIDWAIVPYSALL